MKNLFKKLFRVVNFTTRRAGLFLTKPMQVRLLRKVAEEKGRQKDEFERLKKYFSENYKKIKDCDVSLFVTPLWDNFNKKLEKHLENGLPFSFLRNGVIAHTMFAIPSKIQFKEELSIVESAISADLLKNILMEDYVGMPYLTNEQYCTSANSIHHLNHLVKFVQNTGCDMQKINTIVEWGGGYGNLAKIYKRFANKPVTYVIIDTPFFSCVQWLYLSVIFGDKNVNFLTDGDGKVKENMINIVPLCFLDNLNFKADLFISTWALSESSKYAQDYVANKNWFGAERIILAYQDSDSNLPDSGHIEELAKKSGCKIGDIQYLKGNHYAFR